LTNAGPPVQECWFHAGLIVSDLDNTGGVTSFNPTDADDAEANWLWRHSWWWQYEEKVGTGVVSSWARPVNGLDVHVRRKMGVREVLLLCITAAVVPGSAAINDLQLGGNIRTLVKLF